MCLLYQQKRKKSARRYWLLSFQSAHLMDAAFLWHKELKGRAFCISERLLVSEEHITISWAEWSDTVLLTESLESNENREKKGLDFWFLIHLLLPCYDQPVQVNPLLLGNPSRAVQLFCSFQHLSIQSLDELLFGVHIEPFLLEVMSQRVNVQFHHLGGRGSTTVGYSLQRRKRTGQLQLLDWLTGSILRCAYQPRLWMHGNILPLIPPGCNIWIKLAFEKQKPCFLF